MMVQRGFNNVEIRDVAAFPAGIYLVNIMLGTEVQTIKILKE